MIGPLQTFVFLLALWATWGLHYQRRAARAVAAVQVVERGAVGYFERELPCIEYFKPPEPPDYAHDFCHGEIAMGPGPVQRGTRYPLETPWGTTCDIRVDDSVRSGEPEMTVVYRGRARLIAEDDAGFSAEARLPWLWWTIVARGGGYFEVTNPNVRQREVTVELEGAPALGRFLTF